MKPLIIGVERKEVNEMAELTATIDQAACPVEYTPAGNSTGAKAMIEREGKYLTFSMAGEGYGYYDLFLIALNGDVLYTVAKESDLGENLINGSLQRSPLGKCFQKAVNCVAFEDFEPYAPSNNEPAAFVGAPVKKAFDNRCGCPYRHCRHHWDGPVDYPLHH
jgi:hypothetical protein